MISENEYLKGLDYSYDTARLASIIFRLTGNKKIDVLTSVADDVDKLFDKYGGIQNPTVVKENPKGKK